MKKNFFLPFVAALALTGCSNDEPGGDGNENVNGGGTGYLAINIATVPEGGSRSDQYEQGGLKFEDGIDAENTVESVRFYFFNKGGAPVTINSEGTNYYTWIAPEVDSEGDKTQTVDKVLKAVIVIKTAESGVIPAQVIAVVNPGSFLGNQSMNREGLRGAVSNFASMANAENPSFVMTNSVYMTETTKERVYYQTIKAENIKTTEDEAKNNPVVIYVERNVAKVRVNSSLATTEITGADGEKHNLLALQGAKKAGITVGGKQIYLDLKGWNVTSTLNTAWLLKHIETSWLSTKLGDLPWNAPQYFRCYWADLCGGQNLVERNQYIDFNEAQKVSLGGHTYCNENAEKQKENPFDPTQVIIAGTLCDEKADPVTICEYAGTRVIGEDALKSIYFGMVQTADVKYAYKDGKDTDGSDRYTELGGKRDDSGNIVEDYSDIQFVSAQDAKDKGLITDYKFGDKTQFFSYACLTDAAKAKEWVKIGASGNPVSITVDDLEKILVNVGRAKIWKSGQTYYYADIEHVVGTENGVSGSGKAATAINGVVRNHIYDFNLTGIYGLGTPVYNPGEKIYPQKPVDDDSFIAAQIKILSWRVVNNNLTLNWGD